MSAVSKYIFYIRMKKNRTIKHTLPGCLPLTVTADIVGHPNRAVSFAGSLDTDRGLGVTHKGICIDGEDLFLVDSIPSAECI